MLILFNNDIALYTCSVFLRTKKNFLGCVACWGRERVPRKRGSERLEEVCIHHSCFSTITTAYRVFLFRVLYRYQCYYYQGFNHRPIKGPQGKKASPSSK